MSNSVLIENLPETEDRYQLVEFSDAGVKCRETLLRYDPPSKDSIFPLEYAFYLLGPVCDKTVIVAGELENNDISFLSQLGAHLMFADIADEKIVLPAGDSSADHVFCGPILRHVDPVITARQIRRVLKPGGSAVFNEPVDNESVTRFKSVIRSEYDPQPVMPQLLTRGHVLSVSRAVGVPGRRREFWLTTPLLARMGFAPHSNLARIFQRADAAVLRRWRFVRRFAFRLVWEARKEC